MNISHLFENIIYRIPVNSPTDNSPMDDSPTDNSPTDNSHPAQFPTRKFPRMDNSPSGQYSNQTITRPDNSPTRQFSNWVFLVNHIFLSLKLTGKSRAVESLQFTSISTCLWKWVYKVCTLNLYGKLYCNVMLCLTKDYEWW